MPEHQPREQATHALTSVPPISSLGGGGPGSSGRRRRLRRPPRGRGLPAGSNGPGVHAAFANRPQPGETDKQQPDWGPEASASPVRWPGEGPPARTWMGSARPAPTSGSAMLPGWPRHGGAAAAGGPTGAANSARADGAHGSERAGGHRGGEAGGGHHGAVRAHRHDHVPDRGHGQSRGRRYRAALSPAQACA